MASLPSTIRLFLGLAGVMVMGPWFLRDSGSSELLIVTFNVVALTVTSIIDSSVRFRTGPWRGTVPGLLVFGMCIGAFASSSEVMIILASVLAVGFSMLEGLSYLLDRLRRGGVAVILGFLIAPVLVGSILLMLPRCQAGDDPLTYSDSLFTAVSAVTVTGLTVIDVGSRLSPEGQWVLLGLIQLGGLGVVSLFAIFALVLGNGLGIRQGRALRDALDGMGGGELRGLLMTIVISTLAIELVGALFLRVSGDSSASFFSSLFHSVSAFCNAGFSLHDKNSLQGWGAISQGVMAILILLGGIGFPVLLDLWRRYGRRKTLRLQLQSRLNISVSVLLLLGGTFLLLLTGAGADSWFWSVTARTAGFSTSSIDALPLSSTLILMFLMYIGASPGSTGGGLKTSTLGVLFLATRAEVQGSGQVVAWKRLIPDTVIRTAAVLTLVGTMMWLVLVLCLLSVEPSKGPEGNLGFIDYAFEVTSALATVGLSRGVTSEVTETGKIILEVAMIFGRLGPLALVLAMASISPMASRGERPTGRVMLG
jgi:trk system potassium uptake protein TrkH